MHGEGCGTVIWLSPFQLSAFFSLYSSAQAVESPLELRIIISDVRWVWCPGSYLVPWNIVHESWKLFTFG